MALLERFFPDIYVKSVFELPLEDLKKLGIRGLVFDIDNTVAPFDVAEPDEEIVELFAFLRKEGFKLCILSNNTKERVQLFNRRLGALAIHKAGKPGIKKLNRAMEIMGNNTQNHCHGRRSGLYGHVVWTSGRTALHHDCAHLQPGSAHYKGKTRCRASGDEGLFQEIREISIVFLIFY